MNDNEPLAASVTEMGRLLRARDVSSVELVTAHLDRIARHDDALGAYVTVCGDAALAAARDADAALASGNDSGPLQGIPIAVKDEAGIAGVAGTFGCRALRDRIVGSDAVHVARLRRAGAVVLGTTNMPELGHRGTTDNLLRGPTSNPFRPGFNAGGSSGGSAAAVAAGMAAVAHGSDGGGSVRIPAAMCGVVGLNGTHGRVPRATRPDAFHSRANLLFDGVLARTVADAATTLAVMAGHDPRDPHSIPAPMPDLAESLGGDVAGLRVAFSPDFGGFPVERAVVGAVRGAADRLATAGAGVSETPFRFEDGHAAITDVWLSGTAVLFAALARQLAAGGAPLDDVDPEVGRLIERGRGRAAVDAKLDDVVRSRVLDTLNAVFERHDAIVAPAVGVVGVPNATDGHTLGPTSVDGQPVDPLLGWVLTAPVNFCGYPSACVPAGWVDELPIGVQIVAPHGREDVCVRIAAALERSAPWQRRYRELVRR